MKSNKRFSKASGSDKRRAFEHYNRCGKYAPRLIAKRLAKADRRKGALEI